jgi:hypothetical protein
MELRCTHLRLQRGDVRLPGCHRGREPVLGLASGGERTLESALIHREPAL